MGIQEWVSDGRQPVGAATAVASDGRRLQMGCDVGKSGGGCHEGNSGSGGFLFVSLVGAPHQWPAAAEGCD